MPESPAEIWRRLVKEGGDERWQAYQTRWREIKRRFGVSKDEARAMAAEEFPPIEPGDPIVPVLQPLPPPEEDHDLPALETPPEPEPEPEKPKRGPGRPRKERPEPEPTVEVPANPLALHLTLEDYDRLVANDVDNTSSLYETVVWVNNALPFYQSFSTEQRDADLTALLRRAPCAAAITMLQQAARDPKGFWNAVYSKTVMKYKMTDGDTGRRDDNRPVFDLIEQFEEDLARAS